MHSFKYWPPYICAQLEIQLTPSIDACWITLSTSGLFSLLIPCHEPKKRIFLSKKGMFFSEKRRLALGKKLL